GLVGLLRGRRGQQGHAAAAAQDGDGDGAAAAAAAAAVIAPDEGHAQQQQQQAAPAPQPAAPAREWEERCAGAARLLVHAAAAGAPFRLLAAPGPPFAGGLDSSDASAEYDGFLDGGGADPYGEGVVADLSTLRALLLPCAA
ncbi:hypothetical protein MNEG_11095, partial [Monoraphidium neglectum]